MRTIRPLQWVMELLGRRHAASAGPWSSHPALRDPANTRKQSREVLAGTDWKGSPRTRSGISSPPRLDAAGLTAREIADYLGHEKVSRTQDVYMSRKATGTNAAVALDSFRPPRSAR